MKLGKLIAELWKRACSESHIPEEQPAVLAVTNRYPTRLVLYAAAFQGGWKVHFMPSLGDAVAAVPTLAPKAVFYDYAVGDPAWDTYCSMLSQQGIPFVFLANRNPQENNDKTFLIVLASGGYQAWGDPLTSEEVVKAVDFAGEVAALAHVPVT